MRWQSKRPSPGRLRGAAGDHGECGNVLLISAPAYPFTCEEKAGLACRLGFLVGLQCHLQALNIALVPQ